MSMVEIMNGFSRFRPLPAWLVCLAMLLVSIVPANAMCGLMSPDMGTMDNGAMATVADHGDHVMTDVQRAGGNTEDPGSVSGAHGMKGCDMCAGDGVCDHGICAPAIVVGPDRSAARLSGFHESGPTRLMRSCTDAYQPPPPRLSS